MYKQVLHEALCVVDIPFDAMLCRDNDCVIHGDSINRYFEQLIECCERAASVAIPKYKKNKRVAGWSEFVAPFKDKSIFWHRMWRSNDMPREGIVYELMKKAKADYKKAAKDILKNQNALTGQRMADAFISNNSRDLWNEVKKVKQKSKLMTDKVDDAGDENSICELFGKKYKELYNSVNYDRNSMENLISLFRNSVEDVCNEGSCYSSHRFMAPDVKAAVNKLKLDKSDCRENFLSNNIIHGGDTLFVHLSFLFNCMLSHIVMPKQMLISVLVPIPKNRRKSLCESSNYRSIALSSIVGKVFDRMILTTHADVLSTSNLQFGFKPKHSTTQCTFVLQNVINHYNARGSPCFVFLLDASKAFDRVQYVRLFHLLHDRGLCARISLLLAFLYTNQCMSVRWKSCLSQSFDCTNGIKQGGVLSPTLFCIYFDELLTRLKKCGAGCYLGNQFVGALSYADDVALMAPTVSSAKKLLEVCGSFASEYDVLFNGDKSVLLVSGSTNSHPKFQLSGRDIQQRDSATHLGSIIGDNYSKLNVKKAVSNLYCATNILMSKFGFCSVDVLSSLFFSYCSSFYGCPLWDFSDIDLIVTAWRKCLKRVWKLNIRTRSKFIIHLPNGDIKSLLLTRAFNFYAQCVNSNNVLIKSVMKSCIFNHCIFNDNLHLCSARSSIQLYNLFLDVNLVRKKLHVFCHDEEAVAETSVLIELCLIRDNVYTSDLLSHDIYNALNWFML